MPSSRTDRADLQGGERSIDPTENVKALALASAERQDDLRELNDRRIDAEIRVLDARMGGFEKIAELRAEHSREIRLLETARLENIRQTDVLAGNTAADRALIAIETLARAQGTAAQTLAAQISENFTGLAGRISSLEKSSYEGAGKQAVADPMTAELIRKVDALASLSSMGSGEKSGKLSQQQFLVMILGVILTFLVIGGIVIGIAFKVGP